jgi:hypothetical protein
MVKNAVERRVFSVDASGVDLAAARRHWGRTVQVSRGLAQQALAKRLTFWRIMSQKYVCQ